MQHIPDQAPIALRAAVAWAQYLADAHEDMVAAAMLSDVLVYLDHRASQIVIS